MLLADEADGRRCEQALVAAGVAVSAEAERGGWVAVGRRNGTVRRGRFDPGAAIDLLRQCEQQALEDGFAGLRLAIDVRWLLLEALEALDAERLLAFEAPLTRFVERSLTIVLCQYDLSRLPPLAQAGALRTHPLALIGPHLCANFYYEPPELVLGGEPSADRVAWQLAQLERASAMERRFEDLKDRLSEHRSALERAERRKEEFLTMLAHELRTPLGTISNALQVLRLKGAAGDDTWNGALETAERQVRHQARLVDDLLRRGETDLEAPSARREHGERRPRRVLVVEDNPDAAATMRDLLVLSGHEVELAHSGSEGVQAARQFHPEVVLCDLGLPEMDGFAVATELRRDPATRDVRLIAVTGYGRDEDRRRSKAAGFDLHLTKPVDPGQLVRLLG